MTKDEASKKINELLIDIKMKLAEAEDIADEYQVSFNFSVEYGIGGTYYPKKKEFKITKAEALKLVETGDIRNYTINSSEYKTIVEALRFNDLDETAYDKWTSSDCYDVDNYGWRSSSEDC